MSLPTPLNPGGDDDYRLLGKLRRVFFLAGWLRRVGLVSE